MHPRGACSYFPSYLQVPSKARGKKDLHKDFAGTSKQQPKVRSLSCHCMLVSHNFVYWIKLSFFIYHPSHILVSQVPPMTGVTKDFAAGLLDSDPREGCSSFLYKSKPEENIPSKVPRVS